MLEGSDMGSSYVIITIEESLTLSRKSRWPGKSWKKLRDGCGPILIYIEGEIAYSVGPDIGSGGCRIAYDSCEDVQ
jgi:hypothetical protein